MKSHVSTSRRSLMIGTAAAMLVAQATPAFA